MRLRLRPQSSTHAAEAKQTTGFKREDLAARLNEAINLMRQSYQRGKGENLHTRSSTTSQTQTHTPSHSLRDTMENTQETVSWKNETEHTHILKQ